MKLVKSQQRSSLKEDIVSDCLMIKLEGDSIKDFNPDASIQHWFYVIARRPGGSQTMENIKHAKEAVTVIEASTSQEVEDEVEMVQEMDAVEDIEYDLVEDGEEDSDYKSNFDSEEEDSNDIFDKIAKNIKSFSAMISCITNCRCFLRHFLEKLKNLFTV